MRKAISQIISKITPRTLLILLFLWNVSSYILVFIFPDHLSENERITYTVFFVLSASILVSALIVWIFNTVYAYISYQINYVKEKRQLEDEEQEWFDELNDKRGTRK